MDALAFFYFDPKYFLYVGPTILLAMWAQMKVKSAYKLAGRHQASSGLSGAEAAQRILDHHGISDVTIEPVKSFMGDHYDPRHKVLRLSPEVYQANTGESVYDIFTYCSLCFRNAVSSESSMFVV